VPAELVTLFNETEAPEVEIGTVEGFRGVSSVQQ
jgi:hypothetical protein